MVPTNWEYKVRPRFIAKCLNSDLWRRRFLRRLGMSNEVYRKTREGTRWNTPLSWALIDRT